MMLSVCIVALLLHCTAGLMPINASGSFPGLQGSQQKSGEHGALTSSQKQAVVDKHNALRAGVTAPCTAADMEVMAWDDSLEVVAQSYAEKCKWQHDPLNNDFAWGENLAMSTNKFFDEAKLADFVQFWYDEIVDTVWSVDGSSASSKVYADPRSQCRNYDSKTGRCVIGDYTQVISAKSNRIGCGVAACNDSSLFGGGGTFFVCKYTPAGNRLAPGQDHALVAPFLPGASCAACPGNCSASLCSRGSPQRCEDQVACQSPEGVGSEFCGEDRTPSTTVTTTTVSETALVGSTTTMPSSCNGMDVQAVGSEVVGTDCSKLMPEGTSCHAVCTPGFQVVGSFLCSLGRMVDASYCLNTSAEVRTAFRLKAAASFVLHLSANPSVAALRQSLATGFGVSEALVHMVSWHSLPGRRLSESGVHYMNRGAHHVVNRETRIWVDVELIVPRNETGSAVEARMRLLFVNGSYQQQAFKNILRSFNLTVNYMQLAVPPRVLQSIVVSDDTGAILEIPGGERAAPPSSSNVSKPTEEVVSAALIGGIVGGSIALLLAITFIYCMCKSSKRKFEA